MASNDPKVDEVKKVKSEQPAGSGTFSAISDDTTSITIPEVSEKVIEDKPVLHPPPAAPLPLRTTKTSDATKSTEHLSPTKEVSLFSYQPTYPSVDDAVEESVLEHGSLSVKQKSTDSTLSQIKVEVVPSISGEIYSTAKADIETEPSIGAAGSITDDQDVDLIDLSAVKNDGDEDIVIVGLGTIAKSEETRGSEGARKLSISSTNSSRTSVISDAAEEDTSEFQPKATTSGQTRQDSTISPGTSPESSISYSDYPLVLDVTDSSSRESQSSKEVTKGSQVPSTIDSVEDLPARDFSGPIGRWWQYGFFAKGPKSASFDIEMPPFESPYQRYEFQDPASMKEAYPLVSQAGRLRVGEGNDITPNPTLLKVLKQKIQTISAQIQSSSHSNGRKKKMNLSSRLARLRKRANHEANKIIFAGITNEREALVSALSKLRSAVNSDDRSIRLTDYHKSLTDSLPQSVAGKKVEYIDQILEEPEVSEESSE